jgi:hypothetical protein
VTVRPGNVPGGVTPSATLDGQSAPWPISALPVDSGPHELVVRAGNATIERTFEAAEGQTATLELTWPVEFPRAGASQKAARSHPMLTPAAPEAASKPSLRPWAWATLGLGGAAAAVGTVTGLLVLDSAGKLKDWCSPDPSRCPDGRPTDPTELDRLKQAETLGPVADVSFVVAGAALVGAGLLFVFEPKGAPHKDVKVGLRPGGVTLHGTF